MWSEKKKRGGYGKKRNLKEIEIPVKKSKNVVALRVIKDSSKTPNTPVERLFSKINSFKVSSKFLHMMYVRVKDFKEDRFPKFVRNGKGEKVTEFSIVCEKIDRKRVYAIIISQDEKGKGGISNTSMSKTYRIWMDTILSYRFKRKRLEIVLDGDEGFIKVSFSSKRDVEIMKRFFESRFSASGEVHVHKDHQKKEKDENQDKDKDSTKKRNKKKNYHHQQHHHQPIPKVERKSSIARKLFPKTTRGFCIPKESYKDWNMYEYLSWVNLIPFQENRNVEMTPGVTTLYQYLELYQFHVIEKLIETVSNSTNIWAESRKLFSDTSSTTPFCRDKKAVESLLRHYEYFEGVFDGIFNCNFYILLWKRINKKSKQILQIERKLLTTDHSYLWNLEDLKHRILFSLLKGMDYDSWVIKLQKDFGKFLRKCDDDDEKENEFGFLTSYGEKIEYFNTRVQPGVRIEAFYPEVLKKYIKIKNRKLEEGVSAIHELFEKERRYQEELRRINGELSEKYQPQLDDIEERRKKVERLGGGGGGGENNNNNKIVLQKLDEEKKLVEDKKNEEEYSSTYSLQKRIEQIQKKIHSHLEIIYLFQMNKVRKQVIRDQIKTMYEKVHVTDDDDEEYYNKAFQKIQQQQEEQEEEEEEEDNKNNSNKYMNLNVKLVISRAVDARVPGMLGLGAMNLLNKVFSPKFAKFGFLHTYVLICNIGFHFFVNGFVYIGGSGAQSDVSKVMSKGFEDIVCFDIPPSFNYSPNFSVRSVVEKLSRYILDVNINKSYSDWGIGDRDVSMNCQEFAMKMLDVMGSMFPLTKFQEKFIHSIRTLKQPKSYDQQQQQQQQEEEEEGEEKEEDDKEEEIRYFQFLELPAKFPKELRHLFGKEKKKVFRSHQELDQFVIEIERFLGDSFKKKFSGVYQLLKGFDRAYWLMKRYGKKGERLDPLIRCGDDEDCGYDGSAGGGTILRKNGDKEKEIMVEILCPFLDEKSPDEDVSTKFSL